MKLKRILAVILAFCMVFSTMSFSVFATDEEVVVINNVEEFRAFRDAVNAGTTYEGETVTLNADIDLMGENWTPIGNSTNYFWGTFDGGNHTISNMTIDVESEGDVFVGLFGGVRKATIKNVVIKDASISAVGNKVRAAAVVGIAHSNSENHTTANLNFENITIDGCEINVSATGSSVAAGALSGYCYPANMTNISVSDYTLNCGTTASTAFIGGLVGYMQGQNISNNGNTRAYYTVDTFNLNNITINAETADVLAGGFAGYTYYGYITVKNGTINGFKSQITATTEVLLGGLIGLGHRSDKGNTFTDIEITGIDFDVTTNNGNDTSIGGMIGYNGSPSAYSDCSVSGTITEKCTTEGVSSSAMAGGFTGATVAYTQSYTNCSADVDISATNIAGGFVGYNNISTTYTNCEASGSIADTAVTAGGFAGNAKSANIINCDYTGESDVDFVGVASSNVNVYEAQVGETYYKTLAEAVAVGGEVVLLTDVELAETVVVTKDVTLDLNGKTVTMTAQPEGTYVDAFTILANVTVTGNGTIDARPSNGYTFYVGDKEGNAGNLTIENGSFYGETSVVNNRLGTVTINGGYFEVDLEFETDKYVYVINCIDANYNAGTAVITVNGGTFYQFNPSDNAAEGTGTDFVSDGYITVDNGDGTYGVEINYVATVGDVSYTDVQEAIKAAAPDGTVEIIKDIEVDEWVMFAESLSISNGNIITCVLDGLTINGNNHTLTINSVESAGNGNRLFYDATNLNINDLTIELNNGTSGIGLQSGTLNNVNFVGGGYGVFPGTGEVTIEGCTFATNNTAVYYEDARDNLVVTGCTFNQPEGVNVILIRGATKFTDNTVNSGRTVNVVSGSPVVTGNNFNDVRVKVYNVATATIEDNIINNLEFSSTETVNSKFVENTLSEEAEAALTAAGTINRQRLEGSGTEADPYVINNVNELKSFALEANAGTTYSGKYVKLNADIDLAGITWTPIKNFLGTFDGGNHTVSNFHLDATNGHAGFFYKINFGNGTAIKNLTLSDITATVGNYYVGALAYWSFAVQDNITIRNFTVTTTASEANIGGYAGWVEWGHIRNCTIENFVVNAENGAGLIGGLSAVLKADNWLQYNNIDVKGIKVNINDTDGKYAEVSGLVGQTQTGHDAPVFTNCDISDIDITATGLVTVGGFIARPGAHTTAKNCTTQGKIDVTGVTSADESAGGFFGNLGWNNNESNRGGHKLTNCSADVDIITKIAPAGGFVGSATNEQDRNMAVTFTNCSASGVITLAEDGTANIGGFAGEADRGTYIECSATQEPLIGNALSETIVIKNCVAEIDGTEFYSIQEAIDAAQDGNTVTLLTDIANEQVTIDNKTVVIDLDGHTFNGAIKPSTGNITVKNGSIVNTDSSASAIEINAGELTLTDINIDSARHAVRIDGAVTAVINSGNYRSGIGTGTGTYHAVNVSGAADVTINGGTFTGPKGTTADSGAAVNVQAGATVTILDGTFTDGKNNTLSADGTLTVYGGTFDQTPASYCPVGYGAVDNEGGMFEVVEVPVVYEVSTLAELQSAITNSRDGDTILLIADIETGTASLEINKAVTLDLGGYTLTTYGTYGGLRLKGGCTLTNGTLAHKGTVTAIKAWDVAEISDLVIDVAFKAEGKTIGGIVIQENAAGIDTIRNVTIKGDGLTNGIETYNCGNAQVIGSMENVTIDARGTGMLISAPCGTATNCSISGDVTGIDMLLKGTYTASLDLVNCTVEGETQALIVRDEGKGYDYVGSIKLTADDASTITSENGKALVYAVADAEDVELSDNILALKSLSGSGTEADPYLINNLDDLIWFRDKVDEQAADGTTQFAGKYIKLTADIDLNGINWNPIGSRTGDHNTFKGVFDGGGHTISNLYIEGTGEGNGFFANTAGNAEIKNLTFNNVYINSTDNSHYAGTVVARADYNTKITNVHVTGNIYISGRGYIGGIAGHGYVIMDNVSVVGEGTITSSFWCAGGILGYGGEGVTNITNSHVEGTGATGLTVTSAAGGLGSIVGMAEDNGGTQPISGADLSAKNVTVKTYVGGYGTSYANYALGYLYGGNETTVFTGTNTVENVVIETSTGEAPEVSDAVAEIDGTIYFTFASAVEALESGDTITILRNVTLDETIVFDEDNVILDLNGKTITTSAQPEGTYVDAFTILSNVTVTGNGTVDARPSNGYTFYVGDKNGNAGTLTIENGTFYGETSVVNNRLGTVTINGGNFAVDLEFDTDTYDYTINCIDANYNDGTAVVIITGGTFYQFNPADNAAEGAGTNFVAGGYVATEEGGTYLVEQAPTADYTAVEAALSTVPADLTLYRPEGAQAVTDAVNAVVYYLPPEEQEAVDAYATAIYEAVKALELKVAVELSDDLIDWTLRGTSVVAGGKVILTANTAGHEISSIKARFGGLPEGATIALTGTSNKVSVAGNMVTVINPGLGRVEVPMVITSVDGVTTEFVLVGDFGNAVRYTTDAWVYQQGNNIRTISSNRTIYLLFDVTQLEGGGYVEVTDVSRNLLGRYVTLNDAAVRFYDPVYDIGTVTVTVKDAAGEIVNVYNVEVIFTDDQIEGNDNWEYEVYTPVLKSSLRCTYKVEGDNIIVTADSGVSNVQLNFGRYFAEALSANVNNNIVKKIGARSWRIMSSEQTVTFEVYFDATAYGGDVITRYVTINF